MTTNQSLLGVNLLATADYSDSPYIDLIKSSRSWGTPAQPWGAGTVAVNPQGWPLGDFGVRLVSDIATPGVYTISFNGFAIVGKGASAATNPPQLAYDPKTNITRGYIRLDRTGTLELSFKDTQQNITGPKNAGITNLQVIRPGYGDATQVFTTEFYQHLSPFGSLRSMDLQQTNNCPITDWEQRNKPDTAQWNKRGCPVEVLIDLANRTGKNLWLCVPPLADNNYLAAMLALVRSNLRPDLFCYMQYSNENWNSQFKQYDWNMAAAVADPRFDRTNKWYAAWEREGERASYIRTIAGDDPRIRVIVGTQIGYGPSDFQAKKALTWIAKNVGDPHKYVYAVAGAPYFGPGKVFCTRTDLKPLDVAQALFVASDSTSANKPSIVALRTTCNLFGVKFICYEGGVDLGQYAESLQAKIDAQQLPMTGKAVENNLRLWFDGGGQEFFYFAAARKDDKNGYWGLSQSYGQTSSPKYAAAAGIAHRLTFGSKL